MSLFIDTHRLLPEFRYLTGSRAALSAIWKAYGVQSTATAGASIDQTLYTLLLDRDARGRVLYDSTANSANVAVTTYASSSPDRDKPCHLSTSSRDALSTSCRNCLISWLRSPQKRDCVYKLKTSPSCASSTPASSESSARRWITTRR